MWERMKTDIFFGLPPAGLAGETNEAHARRLEQQRPRDAAAAANKRAIIAFISSLLN